MKILGIDPGSRRTGYGLIEANPQHNRYLSSGCIRLPESKSLAERLVLLGDTLGDLIQQWQPDCGVVEEVFFAKHPRSALVLGHVRGVVLLELGRRQVRLHEYAPRQVKQSLVGTGSAQKEQIQHMVRMLLNLRSCPLQEDEADALAVSLTHAHILPLQQRLQRLP